MSQKDAVQDSELEFRAMRIAHDELDMFGACFAKNSSPRARETLHWQYGQNPTGHIFAEFAVAANRKLAAIYATIPVRLRMNGQIVLGVQSVDTITDAEFRGRGLFLRLARRAYERAAQADAKLVYGFPNGNSAHGFFQRLEWEKLDPVPFLIRPLRSTYVLERLRAEKFAGWISELTLFRPSRKEPARGQLVRLTRFDDQATRLWHRFSQDVGVAVERDASYLNWRIASKPGEEYISHAIVDGSEIRALVCHVVKAKHGGHVGYIMESISVPGAERELRFLIGHALGAMVDAGADVALAWCLPHSRNFTSLVRRGFMPFPRRLWPIELHFGARALHPGAGIVEDRKSWYLSYLDSDTT